LFVKYKAKLFVETNNRCRETPPRERTTWSSVSF